MSIKTPLLRLESVLPSSPSHVTRFCDFAVPADSSGVAKIDSITLSNMKVRVFGNTAVVTGADDEKSSFKGKDTSGHYVWMDVFVNRGGKWQAAASEFTQISGAK
jgi:hypothetical protein